MKKVLIAGMIGNALEWYDYALYAQFATIIGKHFLPFSDSKEIWIFAIFAAGFIGRPIGGIVFGSIGDKLGRKLSLLIGIIAMSVPTAGIGLLPSYASIGIMAPIILTLMRLLQGFSLGGEFSGCIAYMVEYAPKGIRGIAGSAAFSSMCAGMLLGLFTSSSFINFMQEDQLIAWGWRIPFIAGLFIGLVGFYIRTTLSESPIYKAAKEKGMLSKYPLRELFVQYWPRLLIAVVIYLSVTAPFFTATVFVENFMEKLGYGSIQRFIVSALILIIMIIGFPISASISDKIGRRPVFILGTVLLIIFSYPIFLALGSMNFTVALLSQMLFSAIIALYMGPMPTALVEMFPTKVRFTGVALSYNFSAAAFGGTAPMIGMALTKVTGDRYALSYYLIAAAIASLFTLLFFYVETYKRSLEDDSNETAREEKEEDTISSSVMSAAEYGQENLR